MYKQGGIKRASRHAWTTAVLALTTAILAGCHSTPTREPPPRVAHPVGRFALSASGGPAAGVQREDQAGAVKTAAAGAVGAPLVAAYVASQFSASALTALTPALGPLALAGLVLGAAQGATRSAEIERTHGPALAELQQWISGVPLQHEATTAVAQQLEQRFGQRFTGIVASADGDRPRTPMPDTAFDLTVRGVEMEVRHDGRVCLKVTTALRATRVPGGTVLGQWESHYKCPEARVPASLTLNDAEAARHELDQAWLRIADELTDAVRNAGPAIGNAPEVST